MIMNGNAPTLISGVPNVTPSFATIKSHASAIPSAPASTCPFAAQIDGLPSFPIVVNRAGNARSRSACTSGTSAAKPARFAPEENTLSCVEVSTTQRTAASSRAASNAACRSVNSASESALRVSG
jgi:hypothetical protein